MTRLTILHLSILVALSGCTAPLGSPDSLGPSGKGEEEQVFATGPADNDEGVGLDRDLYPADPFAAEFARDLRVELYDSPDFDTDNGVSFNFCPEPTQKLNMTNAAWLAFMAANEYSHLAAIVPAITAMGFGRGGDPFWTLCARDLHQLRELEELPETDQRSFANVTRITDNYMRDNFGSCASQWYRETCMEENSRLGTGLHEKESCQDHVGIAARFEEYLIQSSDPDSYIQFFSGGEFKVEGTTAEFEKGSTQVLFARHKELPVAIVAFRGTEPTQIKDIIADINFFKKNLEDVPGWRDSAWGKVHRGFLNAYQAVAPERPTRDAAQTGETMDDGRMLLTKLEELRGTGVGIWITGHSLGGALATMFTARIMAAMERGEEYNLKGLYTFGSPRVGNDDFVEHMQAVADRYGTALVRVRNEADVVTRVPKIGYDHVGSLAYLAESGELQFQPASIPEPWFGSPADHGMRKYYDKVLSNRVSGVPAGYDGCAYEPPQTVQ